MSQPQLGRYTLVRRLAAGGMGEVWLAEASGAANFKKRVAIKRILAHLAQNEDFVRTFIAEANVMVQLHHGNIMPVLELADHDGELYIVMEYLPGRDLKAVLRELRLQGKRVPVDLALWLVAEVCAGLDYAHQRVGPDGAPLHIVHRDVSPSNIVLGGGGEVKLVDFGIARARGGLHQSVSGTLQGKFVYMSPEQAEGERVDARSDVFSTGLVLYELLCGVRPFDGESETETLRLVRTATITPPTELRPDLDPAIDALLMKALARDPAERYETAGGFRRALMHHLADSRSLADGRTLAGFLAEVFPDGVEPPAVPDGLSVDDALNFQLGGLTPSIDAYGQTRTSSVPSATVSAYSPAAAVVPGAASPPPVDARPPPAPTGRRRFLLVGLLAGVSLAAAVVHWWPQEATLRPRIRPTSIDPKGVTLTLDDRSFDADEVLLSGRSHRVCARTLQGWEGCSEVTLAPGENGPDVVIEVPPPTLVTRITPADVPHIVRLDGQPVSNGHVLPPGQHLVCVEASGHKTQPADCIRIDHRFGPLEVAFQLVPQQEEPPPPPPPVDAGVPDSEPTPELARPKPPPTRYVEIVSDPVADVYRGILRLGPTPRRVRIERAHVTYELRAANHPAKRVVIAPDQRPGRLEVTLDSVSPGYLTVRAFPSASEIFLDGRKLGISSVQGREIPSGRHRLEARWRAPDGTLHKATRTIDIVAGETTSITDLRIEGVGAP